jgi:hypothetical protein
LNLLVVHPQLHLSIFATPSISVRVKKELESEKLVHLHVATKDSTTAAAVPAVVNRLQIIPVSSANLKDADFSMDAITQEAVLFAENLPQFMIELFKSTGQAIWTNKFANIRPNFVVFDVSLCAVVCPDSR